MDDTPVAPQRARSTSLPRWVPLAAVLALVIAGAVAWVSRDTDTEAWRRQGAPITVHAWAPYWQTDSAMASFSPNTAVFGDLSLFAYHTTGVDAISAYPGLGDGVLEAYRAAAAQAGVSLTASIIDDTGSGTMASILADPATRTRHVAAILAFAQANDFDGIDIDYEVFAFGDARSTWSTTSPNWVAFIIELAAALHGVGKTLIVSVPPQYDPDRTGGDRGYWVYDYPAMGEVVDYIRIMAYDYSTSNPGPIAPVGWVEGLVADAAAMVPPEKLILGVPVYGYNWPISTLGVCPPDESPRRQNQSTKSAAVLAAERGVVPTFDAAVGEATFDYNDHITGVDATGAAAVCTVARRVWFSTAASVFERARIASRAQLAGISIWSLGSDDAAVWDAIAAVRAGSEEWPPVATGTDETAAAPVPGAG